MDVAAHQLGGGSIDHPMPLKCRDPGEAIRGNGDVEMPTFTRPGVAGVLRAVIADLESGGLQGLLQCRSQALHAGIHAGPAGVSRGACRNSPKMITAVNTKISGMMIQVLNVTQAASLMR